MMQDLGEQTDYWQALWEAYSPLWLRLAYPDITQTKDKIKLYKSSHFVLSFSGGHMQLQEDYFPQSLAPN